MLEEKIMEDYKKAMKDRDAAKTSTLSFLRAELKNAAIDKRKDKLEDADALAVIKKQIKQRQDSIEQFTSGGRQDLVEKETKELEILKSYLPQQLSEDKIREIIEEAVKETGASWPQDMGKLMKALLPKLSGQADNKLVSELVKARLVK
mgnify:FL=1